MPESHAQVRLSITLAYLLPCPTHLKQSRVHSRSVVHRQHTESQLYSIAHTCFRSSAHQQSPPARMVQAAALHTCHAERSSGRVPCRTLTETLGPVGGAVTNVDTWPKVPVTARACPQLITACRTRGRGCSAEGGSGCACSSCTWRSCRCHGHGHPATCPRRGHLARVLGRCARAQTPC